MTFFFVIFYPFFVIFITNKRSRISSLLTDLIFLSWEADGNLTSSSEESYIIPIIKISIAVFDDWFILSAFQWVMCYAWYWDLGMLLYHFISYRQTNNVFQHSLELLEHNCLEFFSGWCVPGNFGEQLPCSPDTLGNRNSSPCSSKY